MEIETTTENSTLNVTIYSPTEKQVTHSARYDKIFDWYHRNMWNKTQVQNAVEKGWITQEEFENIISKAR